ncbi:class I SAM-dependent methyltransferase [Pseudoxanthomonas suwonensis]|uniref:class I SAM-dependent methyltransferase n=1 Tax=Pseudoxanthomonas suwonensis TaxID=314722 RepID=UPI000697F47F|nr:class I SAM-dependent methyltransferase [Pseudoxanthomonas suwonensis]
MSEGDDERRRAWTRYWSSGRLHSCAGSYAGNYEGAIGAFWRGLAGELPERARVLDLATGNGPLPLLLWELRGDALAVDAVDLAALAPAWYQPAVHRGVHFHSGVQMEVLPFGDASFDCVASQFGFEYADRPRALAECLRVSRPHARLALVMHHAGSVLVRVGREELAHHARLLADDGLLPAARAVLPWIARARAGVAAGDPAAAAARERYNRAMQALAGAAQASPTPDLLLEAREQVHRLLAGVHAGSADDALVALDAYADELEGARLRTAEMVRHALQPEQVEEIAQRLREARPGIEVRTAELGQREGVLAWSLVAAPAAG